MKKIILSMLIFGFALVIIPSKAQAQYNQPYYNNMQYITAQRAVAYAAARARYKRANARKKAKRKVVRRKARRVSSLQMNEQKFKLDAYLPKRTEIV